MKQTQLKHQLNYLKQIKKNLAPLVITLGSLLVLVSILFVVVLNQQNNQDNRSQASGSQPTIAAGCNQPCRTNSNCAVNLRCYYGSCRLAINPTDETCSPASATPTPQPTTPPTNNQPTTNPNATITIQPSVAATMSPPKDNLQPNQPSINKFLDNLVNNPEYRLPLILFGLGILLIIIALLIRSKRKTTTNQHKKTNLKKGKVEKQPVNPKNSSQASSMTHRLKIKQVKPPTKT